MYEYVAQHLLLTSGNLPVQHIQQINFFTGYTLIGMPAGQPAALVGKG